MIINDFAIQSKATDKTKKSETLRLEFTFSILLSKVKKAFMELYQNVFKGLSQSNVFGGQIHSASV